MKIVARTPEEYIDSLPEERRDALWRMHRMIHSVWPKSHVDLAQGMPTFHLHGKPFCAIGSQKNFMALYIMPYDMLDAFRKDLKGYDHGRSCIRFRHLEEQDIVFFERVILYTGSQYPESKYYHRTMATAK